MYTKLHTYREEKKNTRKEQQQQQDTNSTQGSHNTIITGDTLIREKHSNTPAHQLNPKKKKTDPLREAEAEQSQSISPQRLQSLKQTTNNTHHKGTNMFAAMPCE
ncbi:uncharacterized protein TM35_000301770 [Trypanosoma theileri]|uniref:Uncharacterized protein n=1 Tax=Trypanosoma theileri TaxID=67003 RepID=A0A1X0NN58_9TRYP|nr:uncharacterized protein TM35_000301770 [Trypanosoma theileri]ORC86137.1 hypothetical protein TM35_000301770 [Trypanosoma theileri]